MTDVFVAGVGMTKFGRHSTLDYKALTRSAITDALADACANQKHIQWAAFASCAIGMLHAQHMIPGQVALRSMGFSGIPIFNVEGACASSSMAFHLAAQAIQSGSCDVALAVGTEKMNVEDRERMFSVFDSAWDVTTKSENQATFDKLGVSVPIPMGTQSDKPYSMFMDVYAAFCRQHMQEFGTTQRQIAEVAAKNHRHSVHNPLAQYREPLTVEAVLAAPPITYPLTLPMCAPISDGSAAAILCSKRGLKRLEIKRSRVVRLRGSVVRSGTTRSETEYRKHITAQAAAAAYEKTGIGPEEVNVAEVHDATAMGEIIQVENLQLVPYGEGGPAAERGELSLGGRLPVNTSGGLESKGHPIGATGLGQIYELVSQLRGECGDRQVGKPRVAIQENGGGVYGLEEAVAVINIFSST
ncbi:MAG: thiolase family protein [Pseudomonadota bacterium]